LGKLINAKDKLIIAPIEVYFMTKDENEFLDTVPLILKAKKKRRASGDLKIMTSK